MKHLFASGMATEMLTPYADQAKGKTAYAEQQMKPEKGNIREVDGEYYRSGGTLEISPITYELISAPHKGTKIQEKLYAIGAPISGNSPLLVGIPPIADATEGIVSSIIKYLHLEQDKQKEPEKVAGSGNTVDYESLRSDIMMTVMETVALTVISRSSNLADVSRNIVLNISQNFGIPEDAVNKAYNDSLVTNRPNDFFNAAIQLYKERQR